jgi:hypothetical protein
MRFMILPYAAALGFMQLAGPPGASTDLPRLIAAAGVLGSLTVLVYRLGVWRKEMENRLDAIDHLMTEAKELNQQALRRHHRTARRLERLEEHTR